MCSVDAFQKAELPVHVIKHHTMKGWWNGCIQSQPQCERKASGRLHNQSLYPQYPFHRRLRGPQSWPGTVKEKNFLPLLRIKSWFFSWLLVNLSNVLSLHLYCISEYYNVFCWVHVWLSLFESNQKFFLQKHIYGAEICVCMPPTQATLVTK